MVNKNGLDNYYSVNQILMTNYKYSLTELEDMIAWERDVYITKLTEYLEEKNNE